MAGMYYRVEGKLGTYVFTEEELEKGLDRENQGVPARVRDEAEYQQDFPERKLQVKK